MNAKINNLVNDYFCEAYDFSPSDFIEDEELTADERKEFFAAVKAAKKANKPAVEHEDTPSLDAAWFEYR